MDFDQKTLDDADREALGLEPLDTEAEDEAVDAEPAPRGNGRPKMSKAEKARTRYRELIISGGDVRSDLADSVAGDVQADRRTLERRRQAAGNLGRAMTLRAELEQLQAAERDTSPTAKLADLGHLTLRELADALVAITTPRVMTPGKRRLSDLEGTILSLESEARSTLYNTASDAAKAAVSKAHGALSALAARRAAITPIANGQEIAAAERSLDALRAGHGDAHREHNETADEAVHRIRLGLRDLRNRQERARLELERSHVLREEAQAKLAEAEQLAWDPENALLSIDRKPEPFRLDPRPSIGLEGTGTPRAKVAV